MPSFSSPLWLQLRLRRRRRRLDDDDDAPYFPSLPSIMQLRRSDHALIPDDRVITAESEKRVRAERGREMHGDSALHCQSELMLPQTRNAVNISWISVYKLPEICHNSTCVYRLGGKGTRTLRVCETSERRERIQFVNATSDRKWESSRVG